jgi:hypothetical protein
VPWRSKRMARELVVPWSRARMYWDMGMTAKLNTLRLS